MRLSRSRKKGRPGPSGRSQELSRPARSRPSMRARIMAWTSIGVTVVLVAMVLGLHFTVRAKLDNIGHITPADKTHRPPKYNDALNIMLLGSDSRSGHNKVIGGTGGWNCSDTIMNAHISPGPGEVTGLSISRGQVGAYYKWRRVPGLLGELAQPSAP